MYGDRDISTTENGDLIVDNGNLAVSTASNSMLRAINFCLLTVYSNYKPQKDFGASPDSFIGKPNDARTRSFIRMYIDYALKRQGILTGPNYILNVAAVSDDEVAVIIRIEEEILEEEEILDKELEVLSRYNSMRNEN